MPRTTGWVAKSCESITPASSIEAVTLVGLQSLQAKIPLSKESDFLGQSEIFSSIQRNMGKIARDIFDDAFKQPHTTHVEHLKEDVIACLARAEQLKQIHAILKEHYNQPGTTLDESMVPEGHEQPAAIDECGINKDAVQEILSGREAEIDALSDSIIKNAMAAMRKEARNVQRGTQLG